METKRISKGEVGSKRVSCLEEPHRGINLILEQANISISNELDKKNWNIRLLQRSQSIESFQHMETEQLPLPAMETDNLLQTQNLDSSKEMKMTMVDSIRSRKQSQQPGSISSISEVKVRQKPQFDRSLTKSKNNKITLSLQQQINPFL